MELKHSLGDSINTTREEKLAALQWPWLLLVAFLFIGVICGMTISCLDLQIKLWTFFSGNIYTSTVLSQSSRHFNCITYIADVTLRSTYLVFVVFFVVVFFFTSSTRIWVMFVWMLVVCTLNKLSQNDLKSQRLRRVTWWLGGAKKGNETDTVTVSNEKWTQ